jgi:hypothetical protein
MQRVTPDALDAAEEFLWLNARLIDRARFAYHFRTGTDRQVLDALRAYQNDDGGFGHAIEPDLRGPTSQPRGVDVALSVLDEVDDFDDPMVQRACDWLQAVTASDGGVPFVLPTVRNDPRAPWWTTDDRPPGSLVPTGAVAGLLHRRGLEHPWLDRATEFCWRAVAALEKPGPYEARYAVAFLDDVPDRSRAERAAVQLGELVVGQELAALTPHAEGEVHTPLDFSPSPRSLAMRWFDDEVVEAHLDALVQGQLEDGGWSFDWDVWTPATLQEWRGEVTVRNLLRLRSFGRLEM